MHSHDPIIRDPILKAIDPHRPRAAGPAGGRSFAAAFGRDGWG